MGSKLKAKWQARQDNPLPEAVEFLFDCCRLLLLLLRVVLSDGVEEGDLVLVECSELVLCHSGRSVMVKRVLKYNKHHSLNFIASSKVSCFLFCERSEQLGVSESQKSKIGAQAFSAERPALRGGKADRIGRKRTDTSAATQQPLESATEGFRSRRAASEQRDGGSSSTEGYAPRTAVALHLNSAALL